MLQQIRDRAHGWTAKIIVGLIALTFALFGVESIVGTFTNQGDGAVIVNGESISEAEVQTQVQRAVRSGQVPPEQQREARSAIVDQMITRTLLNQYATQGGLHFSDEQMDRLIVNRREFQDSEGRFSSDLFRNRLASAGYTPTAFRAQLKDDMVVQQLQQGLASGSFVLSNEQQQLAALVNQTRTFRYATLDASSLDEPVNVTDQQLQNWYQSHQQDYQRPEQVRLNYVVLGRQQLADQVSVDEQRLQELYQQRRADAPRRVSDIVVSFGDERREEARQRIEEVRSKLAEGGDFATLARQYSDDSASADNGGDLGVVTEGIFGQQFDQAVASLDEGQTSEPLQLDNAFHLIRVTDIEIPAFEDMRDELAAQARNDAIASQFEEKVQKLRDQSFSAGDLESVAQSLGLELQHSGWLSRDQREGLFAEQGVMAAAFGEDVIQEGYNSEVIELDEGRRMVLRVVEHRPAATLPLEEVRDQVRQAVRHQQRQQQLADRASALVNQLRQGQQPALDWQQAEHVTRQVHDGVSQEIVDAAFKLARPDNGQPTHGHTAIGDRQVIIALTNVGEQEDEDAARQVRSDLERLQIQTAIEGLTSTLKAQGEIERQ